MGVAQIPGRLIFAIAARRLTTVQRAAGVSTLGAAALFLLMMRTPWAELVAVAVFGMANGMATLLRATLPGDLYGRAEFGAVSGLISAFSLSARAAAPFAATLIALAPGGYDSLLAALTVTVSAAGVGLGLGVHAESPLHGPELALDDGVAASQNTL
jgi:hypothetical protein